MNTLSTSTLAALEEMLQNTARTAPPDFLPIQLIGGRTYFIALRSADQLPVGFTLDVLVS
jgi:hypothetical protein